MRHEEDRPGSINCNAVCPNCNGSVAVRNPTGSCDHLYWPDLLTPEAKQKIGRAELSRIHGECMRKAQLVFDTLPGGYARLAQDAYEVEPQDIKPRST